MYTKNGMNRGGGTKIGGIQKEDTTLRTDVGLKKGPVTLQEDAKTPARERQAASPTLWFLKFPV